MKSKKMIYWTAVIPVIVIILIVIIVRLDKSDNHISRAMASKSLALALTDKAGCIASQNENGSHFLSEDRDNWYTKYMDYLIEGGYFEEGVQADKEFAANALTYGEAAYAAERISPGLSSALGVSVKKYKKSMSKDEWWLFYESVLKRADPEEKVQHKNILLYGTPDNVKEASAWTAYTSIGIMGFEGNALDAFIDHEIGIIYRGNEIIHMAQDVSDEVVYKNVWIAEGEDNKLNLYLGTIVREFPMNKEMEEEKSGVIADVTLKNGKLTKLSMKKDTVQGKVLSIKEDSIEIEGYGTFKLDKDFRVYKTYGVVKEQKKNDILVGYDLQKFVVADKKLCAALQVKSFSAKNIRVLIMDTGFSTIYHDVIRLKSDTPLRLRYGTSEEVIASGKELAIKRDDARLVDGRLTIEPEDSQKSVEVLNVERGHGTPSYYGTFEVSLESEGLLLVNELDMEDYLTKVVPSEMPASYELEALKAQAVCARTYAYRQIKANGYKQFGAHVDDSTNYQVYGNTRSNDRTDMAIKETYGQMVFSDDQPAETFYFSTSCGHTTDGTIWGASLDDLPYLKGVFLSDQKDGMDLTTNEAFVPFIKSNEPRTFDSGFAMYRWTTTFTNKELEKTVKDVGTIQTVIVTERGTGGIAKTLKIIGSKGEKVVKGQSQIRSALGNEGLVYKKNDGDTMSGLKSLPSAFIAVDETARDEEKGLRTFTIWGGGSGHGVGMSQNGAQGMAKQGKNYKEILQFFFDRIEIKEIDN